MKDSLAGTMVSRMDRLVYPQEPPGAQSRHHHRQSRSKSQSRTVASSGFRTYETNSLQQAVFRGCVECIRVLVESPPYFSVNSACGPEGLRPIHIAAREGHLPVLRFLSSAGGCIEKCDGHGSTGLHHAAWGGQLRAARWLLRHGAQITLDKRGKSPIHVAADLGHTEIVTLLTNHSASSSYGEIPSSDDCLKNNNNSITPSSTTTISTYSSSKNLNSHQHHQPIAKTKERRGPCQDRGKLASNGRDCDPPEGQTGQDLSSSGNFSLGTTTGTSSGSNSPLSPSPTGNPCSCSNNPNDDEVNQGSTTTTTTTTTKIGHKSSKIESETVSSPPVTSFYLHPQRSDSISTPGPKERSSGNQPRRQVTVSVVVEPFYLHPPSAADLLEPAESPQKSNSVQSKLQEIESPEMGPVTPVTSSSDFMPSADSPESEKPEAYLPPPPPQSTSSPPTPPPKIGRVQALKSAIANNESHPPPPPPPPMPKMPEKLKFARSGTNPVLSFAPNKNMSQENNSTGNPSRMNDDENEYEDIEEIGEENHHYEEANENGMGNGNRKLNRSISAPHPPNRNNTETEARESPPQGTLIQPKALPGMRRPFIPPNFPDPPKDALIKPSEYLKSLQQSQSNNSGKYGKVGSTGTMSSNGLRPVSVRTRAEDVVKGLNGAEMPSVPEETTPEENLSDGHHDQHRFRPSPSPSSNGDERTGNIMADALLRVNLRKTPMSRTLSAPAFGRVLPDVNNAVPPHPEEKRPTQTFSQVTNGKPPQGPTPAAIIAELAQSSQVGGVREWKEELRRRQIEEDKAAAKEIASIYSPLKFVAEMPETDERGTPIPEWKRQMMAKKAAEKAKKEAEEQWRLEAEAKRASAIPPWKRQLIQRRESDGKGAQ